MIFKNTSLPALATGLLLLVSACSKQKAAMNESRLFNGGWEFLIVEDDFLPADILDDRIFTGWSDVSLPHTPVIEALVMTGKQWQGTCIYRKTFINPDPDGEKYVALRFGAAMHLANIYLNGKHIARHKGGYLPFTVDLTGRMRQGENTITVVLNNEDNPQIPPGKAIAGLDFNYYGGLYRDVHMVVSDKIRITDPVDAGLVAGGGVYITHDSITPGLAAFTVHIDVANDRDAPGNITALIEVSGPDGKNCARTSTEAVEIAPGTSAVISSKMTIDDLMPWSPDSPSLYTIDISLKEGGRTITGKRIVTGFRSIEFDPLGFIINGERLKIRGTNRHQEYPYVGYAIGANADYRDASMIKQAGFNFVRLSHYPHSEHFMEACDRLGLLVMDAIPGWQFVGDFIFMENARQDLRDMIRRDRNHPSVVLWEASLNESWMPYDFIEDMNRITKEELEGRDSYTCGWMDTIYDVFIPARQHASPPHYWNDYPETKPLLIAEYGDWEYYAQNAGFNQAEFNNLLAEERTSRQLRGDGQVRLSQQALNYQEAHNDNLKGTHAGDANWLMYDYNRGYAPDIESSGIMDIFRIPKFAYWFYRSQKDISSGDTVLFIANYWNDPAFTDVKVYSNCDSISLRVNNGEPVTIGPDRDTYSTKLEHPPFTFRSLDYEAGIIEATGYYGGKKVKSVTRKTPGEAHSLLLEAALAGRDPEAGRGDIIFIHAAVTDKNGTILPDASDEIHFSIFGEGELIGDNPARAEAGIATILFRVPDMPGMVDIKASAEGLTGAILELEIKEKS